MRKDQEGRKALEDARRQSRMAAFNLAAMVVILIGFMAWVVIWKF